MTKRLYVVTVEFEYAVLADSEREALSMANEAAHDTDFDLCGRAHTIRFVGADNTPVMPDGWDGACLVYQPSYGAKDITLGDAIALERAIQNKETP